MQKRKFASNLILFLFFVLVSLAALFSDIFQSPIKTGAEVIQQAKLFTSTDLEKVHRISLKNKSGEYIFERLQNNQISPWHMVSPRDISANSLFIEKLFNALTTIKVKKMFPDEKINASNFSIDKPTSTLNLIDQSGKSIVIVLGLMNTIDNSTYLKISGRSGIFHVEAPDVSLENASILNLIESQIISINLDTIVAFRIYRGNKKTGTPQLEIKKKGADWFDREGNLLSREKIDDYLQDLSSLKSSFIIDKQTDSQKRQINNLARNAEYIVSIEDNKANTIDYNISGITKDLSDIDLKNEEYFIVTISNNTTSYVVKKEFHELFNRKSDILKAAVKKN
jgi:hypothetical protein